MRFTETICLSRMRGPFLILSGILIFLAFQTIAGQEPPPRPVTVTVTAQGLSFGAFSQGVAGGTVTISSAGVRSATGDVILLGFGYIFSTALYELVGNPGTVVSILNGPDVSLPGSNGGSMTLHLGASNPASPFVINTTPPAFTQLNIGGTLTVSNPAANPPGSYSGTFDITFIQE
jgi:hypothetical protein